jgi:uncharacterized protein YggT (Ycf19 family)
MRIRYLAVNLVNLFTTIVEAFLALRFLLKLFGANATAPFVHWVYNMSDALLQPFRGIFPTTVVQNRYVLEFSTIFAMVVYAIIALILIWLINLVAPEPVIVTKRRR